MLIGAAFYYSVIFVLPPSLSTPAIAKHSIQTAARCKASGSVFAGPSTGKNTQREQQRATGNDSGNSSRTAKPDEDWATRSESTCRFVQAAVVQWRPVSETREGSGMPRAGRLSPPSARYSDPGGWGGGGAGGKDLPKSKTSSRMTLRPPHGSDCVVRHALQDAHSTSSAWTTTNRCTDAREFVELEAISVGPIANLRCDFVSRSLVGRLRRKLW